MAVNPDDCVSRHVVEIFDRGGRVKVGELNAMNQVDWARTRDDISGAGLRLNADQCVDVEELLLGLRSMRHEIAVWRGDERVWEGPITRRAGSRAGFEIHAKDVMHYAARTIMRAGYDNRGVNAGPVLDRVALILNAELDRKENPLHGSVPPINVLPHVVFHQTGTDARTSALTLPYQYTVFEHIDSLAAKGGMDYTVVGRAIHFWDTHQPLGRLQETATQADFLGEIVVTEYGMEVATQTAVTDGQGNYGLAGAESDYYGEVELLATAYDESEGGTPPTSAEMESQAERNRSGRTPAPVHVRVPDGSSIDPTGVLRVQNLVPGVWIPVRAEVLGFKLTQMQKLTSMRVTETPTGESISVNLYPAAIADSEAPA